MACRMSGVRVPLAPPFSLLLGGRWIRRPTFRIRFGRVDWRYSLCGIRVRAQLSFGLAVLY